MDVKAAIQNLILDFYSSCPDHKKLARLDGLICVTADHEEAVLLNISHSTEIGKPNQTHAQRYRRYDLGSQPLLVEKLLTLCQKCFRYQHSFRLEGLIALATDTCELIVVNFKELYFHDPPSVKESPEAAVTSSIYEKDRAFGDFTLESHVANPESVQNLKPAFVKCEILSNEDTRLSHSDIEQHYTDEYKLRQEDTESDRESANDDDRGSDYIPHCSFSSMRHKPVKEDETPTTAFKMTELPSDKHDEQMERDMVAATEALAPVDRFISSQSHTVGETVKDIAIQDSNMNNNRKKDHSAHRPRSNKSVTKSGNSVYVCPNLGCGKTFKAHKRFEKHMLVHDPKSNLRCSYCDKVCSNLHLLKKHEKVHVRLKHNRREDRGRSDKNTLTNSTYVGSTETPVPQDVNGGPDSTESLTNVNSSSCIDPNEAREEERITDMANEENSEIHCAEPTVNTAKLNHACSKCPLIFEDHNNLIQHMAFHSGLLTCDICGNEYLDKTDYLKHSMTHPDSTPYRCSHCSKKYKTKEELRQHRIIHRGKTQCSCVICGHSCESEVLMKDHLTLVHGGEQPWPCSVCGKRWPTKKHMRRHMKMHDNSQPYTCDVCQKAFRTVRYLKDHKRTHTGEKRYTCEICGRSFRDNCLKKHRALHHSTERPFKCNLCSAEFKVAYHLKYHMNTHTGETPYACRHCPKKFNSPAGRLAHERYHTDDRRYTCTICDQAFHASSTLKAHMRMHTGELAFKCQYCGKGCTQRSNLRTHLRSCKLRPADAPVTITKGGRPPNN